MANKLIIDIKDITAKDLPRVGNKAANLTLLMSSGFAVPDGFCLTTEAYWQALAPGHKELEVLLKDIDSSRPEKVRDIALSISRLLDKTSIPDEMAGQIKDKYRQIFNGKDPVAVRSSSTVEDLPGLSFAGQYESYLNAAGIDELLSAIKKCWVSLWSERALIYREKNGIEHDNVAMAVIVQRMVPADISGVAFTVDPVANNRETMVVNATKGLGEKLVSGKTNPDQYRITKSSLKIGRTSRGAGQLLTKQQIDKLARTTLKIEKNFGAPQDIEFAFAGRNLYILQSRPITTLTEAELPFPVIWGNSANRDLLDQGTVFWSNWNTRENMPYPLKPLSWSFLNDLLFPAIFQVTFGTTPESALYRYSFMIDLVNGRAYWNMNRLLGHPFFGATIRPVLKHIDHEAGELFTRLERQGQLRPARPPVPVYRLAWEWLAAVKTWLTFPWFSGTPAIQKNCDLYWDKADGYNSLAMEGASTLDLLRQAREFGYETAKCAFPLIMVSSKALWGMFIIGKLTKNWNDLHRDDLLAAIPGNKTTEGALELFGLSEMPAPIRLLFEQWAGQCFPKLEGELKASAEGRAYLDRMEKFLERHGHRGLKDLDFGYPSWGEDRTYVYQMIKGYLTYSPDDQTPLHQYHEAKERRLMLTTEIERRLSTTFAGFIKVRLFRLGLSLAQNYFPLRENEKYYGMRCFPGSRRIVLEIGRRYHDAGLLDDLEDIFFLTVPEIEALERSGRPDSGQIGGLVEKRKGEWQKQIAVQPPFVVRSDGREIETFRENKIKPGRLRGVPASPGRATGMARIIREPSQAHMFKKGEILVAPYTEPGWAPLFLLAKALVMEVGGAVCHGAIIAREYGIPAAVGVNGATTKIKDGDEITVDGNSGEVMVNKKS